MIELPRFDISPALLDSIGTGAEALHFPVLWDKFRDAAVPIYLFRDKGSTRSFAYSLDATGRNIPPLSEHTEWLFVAVIAAVQLDAQPDILRQLQTKGFYVYKE